MRGIAVFVALAGIVLALGIVVRTEPPEFSFDDAHWWGVGGA